MTSAAELEERPSYDILARKTVEILDVVNSAKQLLFEKYNDNQAMWLEAIFRILMAKNSTFLQEERNSFVRNPDVHKILKDQALEMFRVTDESNPWDPNFRDKLLEMAYNLISTFRVLTSFLLQTKLDVSDELSSLQTIGKNIEKYVQRSSAELEKKTAASEPEKVEPTGIVPEKPKAASEKGKSNSESEKAVPAAPKRGTTVRTEASRSASESSVASAKRTATPPVGTNDKSSSSESEKAAPAATKRETTVETEATESASETPVASEKRTATPPAGGRICDVCEERVVVFNNDEEFSVSLHEQEKKHKKAARKVQREESAAVPAKSTRNPEEALRATVVFLAGPDHKYIRVDDYDEFYCVLCSCKVISINNISTHVQGRPHKKNSALKDEETKEEPPVEDDSRDPTSDEVDSADDDAIFRVSSTIPIKSLF